MTRPIVLCRSARTDDVLREVDAIVEAERLLSEEDVPRHDRMRHEADRRDFVAARALVRMLLATYDGRPLTPETLLEPTIRQRCGRCDRPHGRPEIVGRSTLGLSWAHARGVVAAAVGPGSIGVDVEYADPLSSPPSLTIPVGAAEGLAAPAHLLVAESRRQGGRADIADAARWLRWTRAEACVKAELADLDTALRWPLDGAPQPGGRVYELPPAAVATVTAVRKVTLTDWVDADLGTVGSVAAAHPARIDLPTPANP